MEGADGYQVLVYTGDGKKVGDSGADLLLDTEVNVYQVVGPGDLQSGAYYQWVVDAHFLGENGWVSEIVRVADGFIWP